MTARGTCRGMQVAAMATGSSPTLIGLPALLVPVEIGVTLLDPLFIHKPFWHRE